MDDVQIITSNDDRENKSPAIKIFLIIFTFILFSAGIAGLSYFMGTKYSGYNQSPESRISPTQTQELVLPENMQTPTPEISGKLSPTSKASSASTPTPTPSPALKTKILSSTAALDGFRSSNGGGNNTLEIRAGRNSSLVTRGFLSFDISEIPSGAKVQNATLRLYQAKIIGNPYVAGGALKADHLTYGDALDNSDYASPALSTGFASFTGGNTIEWKEVDVSTRLKDDIANARSTSQFRIHFQTEVTGGDATGDFVYFEAKENTQGTGNTPQLVVKYYLPL